MLSFFRPGATAVGEHGEVIHRLQFREHGHDLVSRTADEVVAARVGFISVSDVPVVVDVVDELEDQAGAALRELDPAEDIHASADYRAHLVRVLTPRVLAAAITHALDRTRERDTA